jgi:hypothetical protein
MTVAAPLTAEGHQITHAVGRVTVVVTCIREGQAYRTSVHYTGVTLGPEIPELSQSWPSESEARAAARRACVAFRNQPADVPFAAQVEQALASIAAQLDEVIARAMGGGAGMAYQREPLARLTAARDALRTPAERITEAELVARINADLDRYETDERYSHPLADTTDRGWNRHNRTRRQTATARAAHPLRARNLRELRALHQAAMRRDQTGARS